MSVGGGHTCVLHMGGNLQCFGSNSNGQLGLGSSGGGNGTPTTPMNIGTVSQVSLRGDDTCALIGDGTVQCMGYGGGCQLGNGGCADTNVLPMQVQGLTQAVELATGWNQSCARRMDGSVSCWGAGDNGAIGDGSYTTRKMAVSLPGLTGGVMHIAAGGDHACALMADGTVECWGLDTRGQLGDGITASDHPVGVQIPCPD
jgi:alpha-tubulin suppressor-like RCC1 family protein